MEKLHAFVQTTLGRGLTLRWEDLKSEDGQGATEYGLVIAFVVLTLGIALGGLSAGITGFLGKVATKLTGLVP
jgi:Flp pilus assembly pilin Flp